MLCSFTPPWTGEGEGVKTEWKEARPILGWAATRISQLIFTMGVQTDLNSTIDVSQFPVQCWMAIRCSSVPATTSSCSTREYLRLLVDGAHWQVDIRIIQCCHLEENLYQGQKKLKRPDRSGRSGHIGCSDGFNYKLYKPFLPYKQPNSQVSSLHLIFVLNDFVLLQGREQMQAKLDKLCPSLKQMDYSDYMHFLRVFFGFSNLKNKGII